jgi:hypothetical protein
LLFEANERNAQTVRSILDTYEACSGQVINKDKSSILFSKNTKQRHRTEVMNIMQISSEGWKGRYLGMPSYIGRAKTKTFQYIKDKVWNKIQGWKEKLLSKAGKEILIKAAAQAIPVYTMSCFDLTKSLCDDLSSMICSFWWSQMDKTNKIHWVSWGTLSKPKRVGGLGFRDLYAFNKAMLAKQAWRLLQNPSSLCARVLAAKYHPEGTILEAKVKHGISYSWRSILKGVQILKLGLIWRVGNGRTINIWTDPWLPRDFPRKVMTTRGRSIISRVEELIDPTTNFWDTQLVNEMFVAEDAKIILQIPIHDHTKDFIAWHFDKKGMFSVKSAYKVAIDFAERESLQGQESSSSSNGEGTKFEWKKLWALPLPNKVLHFLWRMATYSLPVRMKLKRRGMDVDTRCPVCYRFDEDGGHCFLKCKPVRKLWCLTQLEHIRSKLVGCNDPLSIFEEIFRLTEEECVKVCTLFWLWWRERNKANVGDAIRTPNDIASSLNYYVNEYRNSMIRRTTHKPVCFKKWSPPSSEFLKINTDGSFYSQSHTGGWGFTIRDEGGVLLAAGAGNLEHVSNALHAEALGMLYALNTSARIGCNRVIFETDSVVLKQAVSSKEYDLSPLGALFQEIKIQLDVNFDVVKLNVCPRSCNTAAHSLAAYGVNMEKGQYETWLGLFPEFVSNSVTGDLASISS